MNHLHFVDAEKEKQGFFSDTLTNVLDRLSNLQESSCLQVIHNSITFFIHFNDGKLIYATNSLAPFERLERQLRRLSNQNSKLDNSIIKQPRDRFRNNLRTYTQLPSDYQSILWLSEQGHLNPQEAVTLLRRITREVFESFLCLPDSGCQYRFISKPESIQEICRFNLKAYQHQCKKRLQSWHAFADKVWSTYQRPYLVTEKTKAIGDLTPQQNQTICKLLKGLNFRQISAVLDLDELVIAKLIYPSILEKDIVVRDPKPPFDRLPKLHIVENYNSPLESSWRDDSDSVFDAKVHSKNTVYTLEKTWKVACVDDDLNLHQDFLQYLERDLFLAIAIKDSFNAFSELINFNPDIIFLDADMPDLNGYELCQVLRNHQDFKSIPIILLQENQGLLNSGKLRASGATDSLQKPFNRIQLLSVIQQYLDL